MSTTAFACIFWHVEFPHKIPHTLFPFFKIGDTDRCAAH